MYKRQWILLMGLLFLIPFIACSYQGMEQSTPVMGDSPEESTEISHKISEKPVELQLMAVGDIMVHGPQLKAQFNSETGAYDFNNNFQFVKTYLSQADLAICNLETTFGGEALRYSSFPRFNTPDSLGEALKNAGFDLAVTANNHSFDTNYEGAMRTLDILRNINLDYVGTKESVHKESFIIKDVNDIRLGITAYTYETPPYNNQPTLNSIVLPKQMEPLINTFRYERLEEDLQKMQRDIQRMKQQGAEMIIFYLHWGEEYQRKPNDYQKYIAHSLASYGADIILGSHPHVLQPVEIIKDEQHQIKNLIVYSMGNFLSNQRYEILKNRHTEDGVIFNIKIKRNTKDEKPFIGDIHYIPTWVHKYTKGNKRIFDILPLKDALSQPETYHLIEKDSLWRAEQSYENTTEIFQDI